MLREEMPIQHEQTLPLERLSFPGRNYLRGKKIKTNSYILITFCFLWVTSGLSNRRGSKLSSHPEEILEVGERVIVAGQRKGVVRYSGEADFAPGN